MSRKSWYNRIESHYNKQVNVEAAKYLGDSVCIAEHRRTRMCLRGIVLVMGRKKKRQREVVMLSSCCHLFPASNDGGLESVSECLLNVWGM